MARNPIAIGLSFNPLTGKPFTEKKRTITEAEKRRLRNIGKKCQLCGKYEKQVGELQIAHKKLFSKYKSDRDVFLLCPTCHRKYDKQKLSHSQVKKLGMTYEEYLRYTTRKKKPKNEGYDFLGIGKPKKAQRLF